MRAETRSFYEAAVVRAVERITESLDEALDLGELARGAELSPFHFHRIFRGMLGETPLEMHRRLRLERAASQLLGSTDSVTGVAFDAGYDTHEAFTRAFRDAYGTSPSAFRLPAGERSGCLQLPQTQLAARSGVHFGPGMSLQPMRFATGEPTMKVTIEEMPTLRVATVAHLGPYNRISEAFQRLAGIAGSAGLLRDEAMMLAIYYDDPETTPAEELHSDAGLTVPDGAYLPSEVIERRLPAGQYARATHVGPYTTLGDTWARMMGEWLPRSGHRVGNGPTYEVYRNNPSNTRPEELRTDLYVPIA
jgi:AraC family transcriptional regulator